MKRIECRNISNKDMELAEKYVPCLVFDEKEPFLPKAVGISIFYDTIYPASLLFQRLRNYKSWSLIQRFYFFCKNWVLVFYHTMIDDRKTNNHKLALYKFYYNRPEPVYMYINDKWKKRYAAKVIEYAFYYDSDIIHVYDLEHAYAYLDKDDKLIGVKATRHGVIMTHYGKPEDIKYYKGHPILYCVPGKHNHVVTLKQVNQRMIRKSCKEEAGSGGIYPVQFFDKSIWKKIRPFDLGRKDIHQIYLRKFAFNPSFRFNKPFIPPRTIMMPWYQLMNEIPDRLINFLKKEVN